MTITMVFFDAGETLVDETRMWAAWARWLDVPEPAMFAALGATIERGGSHREALALVRPGIDLDAEAAARAAAGDPDGFRPEDVYSDAGPALAELRHSGRRVGMAGNTDRTAEAVLATVGAPGDLITSAEAIGAEKPAPAFFRALAELAGEPPEWIAYVGDRLDNDVLPAQAAGMTGVHVRRGPWGVLHAARPEAALADLRVDGLRGLPALLDALSPRA